MMHIVLVHQDLFFRGGQHVTAALARGFAAAGHRVDVVVSKVHDDLQREHPDEKPFALAAGTGVHVLPSRRAMFNVIAMARKLRELKPDVILTCTGHYNECVALAKIIGRVKTPVVYVEHNPVGSRPDLSRGGATVRYWFDRWILRRRVAKIVAVSEGLRKTVIEKFGLDPEKVVVVHNPVFAKLPNKEADEANVHAALKEKGVYRVVSAGGLAEGKAFDELIVAFGRFEKMAHRECMLVIFGEGPLRGALEKKVEQLELVGKVVFAGYTKHLLDNLKCADLFAYASRYETFGNVLVEALAAGLPIVCVDCPVGPREILKDGELGQLVPVGDCETLAAGMLRVYRGEWRTRATCDLSEYTEEKSAKIYLDLMGEVVG